MKFRLSFALLITTLLFGCSSTKKQHIRPFNIAPGIFATVQMPILYDSSRNRSIPIAIYSKVQRPNNQKIVIFNVGYGGTNKDYSYIAYNLSAKNYFVVVIQHDLPTDTPIPTTGDIYKLRKPFWDRGVQSILFVIAKMKRMYPDLDYDHLIMMGHSNGADMAMLIANEYPKLAKTVITLDNRRMPFPRTSKPKIFSIRSSDQPADPGVIPSLSEQEKYHIKIVKTDIKHDSMGGYQETDRQKNEINNLIMDYLNNPQ
jgi:dienelactone hydrolase